MKVSGHEDLVRLTDRERTELCREIREFLISSVSLTGGHLAGNLGVVEAAIIRGLRFPEICTSIVGMESSWAFKSFVNSS